MNIIDKGGDRREPFQNFLEKRKENTRGKRKKKGENLVDVHFVKAHHPSPSRKKTSKGTSTGTFQGKKAGGVTGVKERKGQDQKRIKYLVHVGKSGK